MTQLLEQAITAIRKLPEDIQDAIATRLLAEMEDESVWSKQFALTSDNQWDLLANKVRKEIMDGNTLPLSDILSNQTISS